MSKINLRRLCEGAIFAAASIALSYLKISVGFFGGSIDLVMVPIIICAVRWGCPTGLLVGFVVGSLKILTGSSSVTWQSFLLDYSLAYMMVGLAGVLRGKKLGLTVGGLIGCAGRFVIHFISGITIYAEYMPDTFLGMNMSNVWIYSVLYNIMYMLPNTIIVIIVGAILTVPLSRYTSKYASIKAG